MNKNLFILLVITLIIILAVKKYWKLLIPILLISVIFIITNPTQNEFELFLKNKFQTQLETASKNTSLIEKTEKIILSKTNEVMALRSIKREDYILFSIYEIEIQDKKHIYIGFLKKFFVEIKT